MGDVCGAASSRMSSRTNVEASARRVRSLKQKSEGRKSILLCLCRRAMMGRTRYLVCVTVLMAFLYGLQVTHVCVTNKPPRKMLNEVSADSKLQRKLQDAGGTSAWWDDARRRVLHVSADPPRARQGGVDRCESENFPCDLKHALSVATPGCTILLGPGTFYTSEIVFPIALAGTHFVGNGVNRTRIVYTLSIFEEKEEEEKEKESSRERGRQPGAGPVVVIDIHAPSMEIQDLTVVLDVAESWRPTSRDAIALFLHSTADDVHITRISVERTTSGSSRVLPGSNLHGLGQGVPTIGILIHGAQECSIDGSYVLGPFTDGIIVMTYNTRVRGSIVDGAHRIGIAIIHEKPGAISVVNKIKSNIVRNVGVHGTAIEIQGNGTHVKSNVLHHWGKYGIVICGPPGKMQCGKCHYTRQMKSIGDLDSAFVVSGAHVKENSFSGNGVNEVCDNGILTVVEGIGSVGHRSAWPMPVMTAR